MLAERRALAWVALIVLMVSCGGSDGRHRFLSGFDFGSSGADSDGADGGEIVDGDGEGAGPPPLVPGPPCEVVSDCPLALPHCVQGRCLACEGRSDCGEAWCVSGQCLPCVPGVKKCSANRIVQCDDPAVGFFGVETCPSDGVCNAGQCFACYPSTKKCEAGVASECAPDGSGWVVVQKCAEAGLQCQLGVCLSPCSSDLKANTNAGCGFYAVDLDNAVEQQALGLLDAWGAPFAVITSNTSDSRVAHVRVVHPDGVVDLADVAPRSLHTFILPPDFGQDGTRRSKSAFGIEADVPITVYQFNPLSNVQVFSNDASVLLPTVGLSQEYYAMSYGQLGNIYRGFVALVGVSDATTQVQFTPATATLGGEGIPPMAAWETQTLSIARGEVINIESDTPGGDLTGSHVFADGPIAVFSGHEAVNTADRCCADHLEQQMVPVSAWGKTHVLTPSIARGKEQDHYRILAAEPLTSVTITPAVATPRLVLQAGGFLEFKTDQPFVVSSDNPVMVAQFLASSYEILDAIPAGCGADSDCPGPFLCGGGGCYAAPCAGPTDCPVGYVCTGVGSGGPPGIGGAVCQPIGDPAMILGVPVGQWRKRYVFLTPDSYAHDYINIVSAAGATVSLDDQELPAEAWTAIGDSGYQVVRTVVGDGVHTLSGDRDLSVVVYGYDKDVSYGYPGGLGLQSL